MKRRLHLTEGSSDKFWYIDAVEDRVTVRYGRSGTAGTTRTKQYESADKALAEAEKQVAAKTKKGYTDEASVSPDALAQVELTQPGKGNGTGSTAGERTAPPVPGSLTPLDVPDVDAADLGLRITPFERAYDIGADVRIEMDDLPFDPEEERDRAERIVSVVATDKNYYRRRSERLQFSEPLFDRMPGPERIAWWVNHLNDLNASREKSSSSPNHDIAWPTWLEVVLRTMAQPARGARGRARQAGRGGVDSPLSSVLVPGGRCRLGPSGTAVSAARAAQQSAVLRLRDNRPFGLHGRWVGFPRSG